MPLKGPDLFPLQSVQFQSGPHREWVTKHQIYPLFLFGMPQEGEIYKKKELRKEGSRSGDKFARRPDFEDAPTRGEDNAIS